MNFSLIYRYILLISVKHISLPYSKASCDPSYMKYVRTFRPHVWLLQSTRLWKSSFLSRIFFFLLKRPESFQLNHTHFWLCHPTNLACVCLSMVIYTPASAERRKVRLLGERITLDWLAGCLALEIGWLNGCVCLVLAQACPSQPKSASQQSERKEGEKVAKKKKKEKSSFLFLFWKVSIFHKAVPRERTHKFCAEAQLVMELLALPSEAGILAKTYRWEN